MSSDQNARLTVDEAAARLGVKRSTIYAYVSRGVIVRYRDPATARSLFDADAIEDLARRGRPRTSTRDPRVDLVVPTALTTIPSGAARSRGHRYRDRPAVELADSATFEEVAGLLIDGELGALPARPPRPAVATADCGPDTCVPADRSEGEPRNADPLRPLRAAVERAAADDALSFDHGAGAARAASAPILDALVTAVIGGSSDSTPLHLVDGRVVESTIAGRLATSFNRANDATRTHGEPSDQIGNPAGWTVEALNATLVLLADHELAASTFAARVAASTRASPYACVVAALATLSGPLHGSAGSIVRAAIDSPDPVATLLDSAGDGPVPGFGHLLYDGIDPRCEAILRRVRAAVPHHRAVVACDTLCAEVARRRRLPPNIDVGLATLSAAAGWASHSTTIAFAVARTAGWLAHVAEEYGETPLRFRARAVAIPREPAPPSEPTRFTAPPSSR